MKLSELKSALREHPEKPLRVILPDGGMIPTHFHITEVGHVTKNFIDCGGTRRTLESVLLQTWVANDVDHRLLPGKFADILALSDDFMPSQDLLVELEYEDSLTSQFTVDSVSLVDQELTVQLGLKHTDCLAKDRCLPDSGCCTPEPAARPAQETKTEVASYCSPSSGCC